MPTNPAIFLDFDGVLHPGGAIIVRDGEMPHPDFPEYNYQLFSCVAALTKTLARYAKANVQIVVSSDWQYRPQILASALRHMPEEISKRVVGCTHLDVDMLPLEFRKLPRGEQVRLSANARGIKQYIALDDRSDGFERHMKRHLLQTHPYAGFCPITARRLRDVLEAWE